MLRAAYVPLCEEERQELERERQADRERTFLSWTASVKDPRQAGKVLYPLDEILLVILCSILSGQEGTCESMHEFATLALPVLRQILPFKHGIPCADTYWRVLSALDAKQFATVLAHWQRAVSQAMGDDVQEILAIDGKTIRGSLDKAAGKSAIHLLSAYATQSRVVLAQRAVDGKSNEIKELPEILKVLDVKKTTVTIDAMGCQKKVAETIIAGRGDYVLALKGNHGTLYDLVKDSFEQAGKEDFPAKIYAKHEEVDKGHGRVEKRLCVCTDQIAWLGEDILKQWPGLRSLVMVEGTRWTRGKEQTRRRFFISSLPPDAARHLHAVRAHWSIESMHWMLDMTFGEDGCRSRQANVVKNVATLRKMALNLLQTMFQAKKAAGEKMRGVSLKSLRRMASWDPAFLWRLLRQSPLT